MKEIKTRKYNTKPNKTSFKKGHKLTRGKLNANWKGDKVGYGALHDWLKLRLGKPQICDRCLNKYASKYEWANKSGKYKRDVRDWVRLCKSCHMLFDKAAQKIWATRKKRGTDKWKK